MRNLTFYFASLLVLSLGILGCQKKGDGPDGEEIRNRQIPFYDEIPTEVINNYVNRMFIDFIGREPLDSEMVVFVDYLKANDLSADARDSLLRKLQSDTTFSFGEGSYNEAYYHWFYEKAKGRFYQEYSDDEFFLEEIGQLEQKRLRDSLNGDTSNLSETDIKILKLQNVLDSKLNYRYGKIELNDMMAYMIDNGVYDIINMNTFNFINASFDNMFYRFPSQEEFYTAFDIIEYNKSRVFWGLSAQNKQDYIDIIVHSREFYNGLVIWAYRSLLSRFPETLETAYHMERLMGSDDFQRLQRDIMVTDEYAQFEPRYEIR